MATLLKLMELNILEEFGDVTGVKLSETYMVTSPVRYQKELDEWTERFRTYLKEPYIVASFETEINGQFGPQSAKRYGLFTRGIEWTD